MSYHEGTMIPRGLCSFPTSLSCKERSSNAFDHENVATKYFLYFRFVADMYDFWIIISDRCVEFFSYTIRQKYPIVHNTYV